MARPPTKSGSQNISHPEIGAIICLYPRICFKTRYFSWSHEGLFERTNTNVATHYNFAYKQTK